MKFISKRKFPLGLFVILILISLAYCITRWIRSERDMRTDKSLFYSKTEYRKGLEYYKTKDYDRAIVYLKKAAIHDPMDEKVYKKIVNAYKLIGKTDEAVEYFEGRIAGDKNNHFLYYGLGLALGELDSGHRAIENLERAIHLAPDFTQAYNTLVNVYSKLDSLDGALQFMNQLIKLDAENSCAYHGLGHIYKLQAKWKEALENLEKAIGLDPELLDAYILKNSIYRHTGRIEESLEIALLGNQIAERKENLEFQEKFLNDIGGAYWCLSDFHKAIDHFEKSLEISRKIGDKRHESTSLSNIGLAYRGLSEFQEAIQYFSQALEIDEELGDKRGQGMDFGNIGDVYVEIGDASTALEYHTEALKIGREVGDRKSEAIHLGAMSTDYSLMGDYPTAMKYSKEAIDLHREIGFKAGESNDLGNMGSIYFELGEYSQALECLGKALRIAEALDDKYSMSLWLGDIGNVYYLLGIDSKALKYYERALLISQEIGDRTGEGMWTGNLANIHATNREYSEALKYLENALKIFQESGAKREEAITLHNMSIIHAVLSESGRALDCSEEALRIHREIKCRYSEAEVLLGIGKIKLKLEDYAGAEEYYKKARKIGQELRAPRLIWETEAGWGLVCEEKGKYREALEHYESAVEAIEDVRGGLVLEEHKWFFFEDKVEIYKRPIECLFKLYEKYQGKGYDKKAFRFAEMAKSRAFLDILSESKAEIWQGTDPVLLNREKELLRNISEIQTQLRNRRLTSGEISELKNRLESEEERFDNLRFEIRKKLQAYAILKYPEVITLDEVQRNIIEQDQILFEYSMGKQHSYLWAVTRHGCNLYRLPSENEIRQEVEEYLHIITHPPLPEVSPKLLGKTLYDILIRPAGDCLSHDHDLIIIPDGVLYYLPFETLISEIRDGEPKYLLESCNTVYSPSASVLKSLNKGGAKSEWPYELLALGNPIFEEKPSSVGSDSNQELHLYEDYGFHYGKLPHSRFELIEIASLFSEDLISVYVGADAKEERVKSENLSKYRRIHFATHGILNEDFPGRSCLVLALDDDLKEDGFLQLNEVFNLKLDADLVVLSACHTGGKLVDGEGLIGLSRAFFYAGARSVIMSLWAVNDRSTASLMERFYYYLCQGKKESEALRFAKLELLKGGIQSLQHPYHWAPFVLMGKTN